MLNSHSVPLSRLAWIAAILPLATTHICYLVAAWYQHVPWCIPYWDSCTSISATGRVFPAKWLFKAGMIPTAMVITLLWWCTWHWLRGLDLATHPKTLRSMPVLGTVAALSLILYTLALGEVGEGYRVIRRTGVVFTFALTYISQLLLVQLLGALARIDPNPIIRLWRRRMMGLLVVLLSVGILSVLLDALMGDAYDAIEDAFEWWLALMLYFYFALLAMFWQQLTPRFEF